MDYFDLKREIEIVFGKKISNRHDCEAVSEAIYKKTKYILSYNTLRRLFQLAGLKSTTTISNKTRDILANYCGYRFYNDFKNNISKNPKKIYLYKLQLELQQKEQFSLKHIESCLEQIEDEEQLYILVNYIVVLAFERKDTEFLKQIFQLKRIFNGDDYLHAHLYFLIQSIGVQVQNHPEYAMNLWVCWAEDPRARFYYFELFVDISRLVHSHYIGIEYYLNKSSKKQDLVFANALLTWRHIILNDIDSAKAQLANIDNQELLTDIHPIPAARLLNCKISIDYLENGLVSNALIQEVNAVYLHFNKNTHPFFEHFICEGLAFSSCYELALSYIQGAKKKTQIFQDFYLIGSIERLKILEAYCLHRLGEKGKAKQIKKAIKLDQLDSFCKEYDSIFYYAIYKSNCPKEIIQQIEHLGYRYLFDIL